jgi:predicted TPR repeat methyltransferase
MLDADDSEACCQYINSILALPAVQEEWRRVGDYSRKAFQQELARVRNWYGDGGHSLRVSAQTKVSPLAETINLAETPLTRSIGA